MVNFGNLQGIKISREAPAISHLLYTDDILISCKANSGNASSIAKVLHKFGLWSGQLANPEKSHLLFSKNEDKKNKRLVKELLGFKELHAYSICLGNTLVFGRNKTKEFSRLKEKVQSHLEGWQSLLLS